MKAVVYHQYAGPSAMQFVETDRPQPKANEVLVAVKAVSINEWDWGLLHGRPFVNRLMSGLFKPGMKILGCDVAGIVESVGTGVQNLRAGDAVFGDLSQDRWGGFAEYVCGSEKAFTLMPSSMNFPQAASLPQAGLLAWQGLYDLRPVSPGMKILINGAGGGAGTFALQIAKALGAETTGVDCPEKLGVMRDSGADHVVDYTNEDFTLTSQKYDLILDMAAHRSLWDYRKSLSPGGYYGMVGGASRRIIELMILGPWFSLTSKKKMGLIFHKPNRGMDKLIELFEQEKIKPVIDRIFTLAKTKEAMEYYGGGKACGKVVITVGA